MHELTIAQNICQIIEREISNLGVTKTVKAVRLRVGKLSGVVPDALRFCFGFVSEGTPLAGVSLEIQETPVEAQCNSCKSTFNLEEPLFICPTCASGNLAVLSGQDLLVESIEVEELQC